VSALSRCPESAQSQSGQRVSATDRDAVLSEPQKIDRNTNQLQIPNVGGNYDQ